MLRLWSVALVVLGAILLAQPVLAEGFVSVRFGGAFTEDGDVKLEFDGGPSAKGEADFDDSVTGGVRGGYWIDPFDYVGFGMDISVYSPDSDGDQITSVPISFLVMARLPLLRDDTHPHGIIQPYAGVGPGVFITVVDIDEIDYVGVGADVGLDVVGGLNFQVTKLIGLFAEYRYTHYKGKVSDDGDLRDDLDIDLDLDTHHITAGIGFHF